MINSTHKPDEVRPSFIQGKMISSHANDEIKKCIAQIIWFSYREKIPPIMKDVFPKENYTCDRGWGCMLRCGQMMLAEALKRHFNYTDKRNGRLSEDFFTEILVLFLDSIESPEISPFSIHQIAAQAYEYFELKPGEWYKPSNIMVTLSKLNDKYQHPKLKTLKTCIFLDGTVFEDQIIEKAYNKKLNNEFDKEENTFKQQKEFNDNFNTEETKEEINHFQQTSKENIEYKKTFAKPTEWDNQLLVFIATKTGLDEHNELYLNTIFQLLTFRQSIGMLGGRGSKAYYFIGFQNQKLLYFDPHYVQDSPHTELGDSYKTYFLEKCFQIHVKDIDTSVGFGFYLRNADDYYEFKSALVHNIKRDQNFLVGFETTTPTIDIDPEDVIECENDDSFEVIG